MHVSEKKWTRDGEHWGEEGGCYWQLSGQDGPGRNGCEGGERCQRVDLRTTEQAPAWDRLHLERSRGEFGPRDLTTEPDGQPAPRRTRAHKGLAFPDPLPPSSHAQRMWALRGRKLSRGAGIYPTQSSAELTAQHSRPGFSTPAAPTGPPVRSLPFCQCPGSSRCP